MKYKSNQQELINEMHHRSSKLYYKYVIKHELHYFFGKEWANITGFRQPYILIYRLI